MIEIATSNVALPVDPAGIRVMAEGVLEAEEEERSVSLVFVTDDEIRELHRDFLDDDRATDVISFPLPDGPDDLLGEIYVSVDRSRQVAAAESIPPEEELLRYVVHGLLHLCGYDDQSEEEKSRMWKRQESLLKANLEAALQAEEESTVPGYGPPQ